MVAIAAANPDQELFLRADGAVPYEKVAQLMALCTQAGIAAVIFFDAGNAFGDPYGNGHINLAGLRTSYGAGIRWQSPIGPLRFEYGIPINPHEDERKSVFDFSIGSFF